MMLAVFSIITALLAYRTSLRYAINGLLQRPCDGRASLAMYNTHEEVDRLVTGCNVFTVCWDNREALWLYCRIRKIAA